MNKQMQSVGSDYAQKEPSRVTGPHPHVHKGNTLRERLNINVGLRLRASATLVSLLHHMHLTVNTSLNMIKTIRSTTVRGGVVNEQS